MNNTIKVVFGLTFRDYGGLRNLVAHVCSVPSAVSNQLGCNWIPAFTVHSVISQVERLSGAQSDHCNCNSVQFLYLMSLHSETKQKIIMIDPTFPATFLFDRPSLGGVSPFIY